MNDSAWVGVGLTVLGLGLPAAVALLIPVLKLAPKRQSVVECPIREHEARMSYNEQNIARLEENLANIKASLLRIETKVEYANGKRTNHD